jgi:hypothetical protein
MFDPLDFSRLAYCLKNNDFREEADYELRGRITRVKAEDAIKLANDIISKLRTGP